MYVCVCMYICTLYMYVSICTVYVYTCTMYKCGIGMFINTYVQICTCMCIYVRFLYM